MATPVKVGGKNDLYALREARRHHASASGIVGQAMRQLGHMRESVGRPDYGSMERMLGQLALDLAALGRGLDEMWVIRAQAGMEIAEVEMRLLQLQDQIDEIKRRIGEFA